MQRYTIFNGLNRLLFAISSIVIALVITISNISQLLKKKKKKPKGLSLIQPFGGGVHLFNIKNKSKILVCQYQNDLEKGYERKSEMPLHFKSTWRLLNDNMIFF